MTLAVFYDNNDNSDDIFVHDGEMNLNDRQLRLLVSAHIASALKGKTDTETLIENSFTVPPASGLGSNVKNILAAKLGSDGSALGLLICLNKTAGDFNTIDMNIHDLVAGQTSGFLSNRSMFMEMQDLFMGVLSALAATIDAKDAYTGRHSDRVANLSQEIALRSGLLREDQIRNIHLAGMLHDIGKIAVPEHILTKPGKVTEEEFNELKKHPKKGADILKGIKRLDEISTAILTHHERYDGKGYPRGLAGEDIPLAGRIICLADSFDAMASNRPYRNALPMEIVRAEIEKGAGTQFDPRLAKITLSLDLEQFTA